MRNPRDEGCESGTQEVRKRRDLNQELRKSGKGKEWEN
jgi:hypothetical protein